MKIYIAGPMRGYPEFNFPAFFAAETMLQEQGHTVFNPARRDNEDHGADISKGNTEGCIEKAGAEHGFDIRKALAGDLDWICREADAVYVLRGWSGSSGAVAERAAMEAVGGKIIEADDAETVEAVKACILR
jgi:hypothetical protein